MSLSQSLTTSSQAVSQALSQAPRALSLSPPNSTSSLSFQAVQALSQALGALSSSQTLHQALSQILKFYELSFCGIVFVR